MWYNQTMTREDAQRIAAADGLGQVHFQFNVAKNGNHGLIEVGYVTVDSGRELFCKRQPNTNPDQFYLCNQFRELATK